MSSSCSQRSQERPGEVFGRTSLCCFHRLARRCQETPANQEAVCVGPHWLFGTSPLPCPLTLEPAPRCCHGSQSLCHWVDVVLTSSSLCARMCPVSPRTAPRCTEDIPVQRCEVPNTVLVVKDRRMTSNTKCDPYAQAPQSRRGGGRQGNSKHSWG